MKELKLRNIKTTLPFTLNKGLSVFNIHQLLAYRDYELDFDVFLPSKKMNLQRPFVWTLEQKQELIISLLKGIEISTMAMISYDHKIMRIIDGKQRLSTWLSFAKNEFPIVWNGETYMYENFDGDAKYVINHTYIKADVAYEYPDRMISDEWKIKWFELINFAGTKQDADHLELLKR